MVKSCVFREVAEVTIHTFAKKQGNYVDLTVLTGPDQGRSLLFIDTVYIGTFTDQVLGDLKVTALTGD